MELLQLTGVRPFKSKKFDITKHKRYGLLKDSSEKNNFDIEIFLKKKRKENVLDIKAIAKHYPDMQVKTCATYDAKVAC